MSKNESKFQVDYHLLAPNWIHVYIDNQQFLKIQKNNEQMNNEHFKNYLKEYLRTFRTVDNTGAGGKIEDSDYTIATDVIISHFGEIENCFNNLKTKDQGIKIITSRAKKWHNDDKDCGVFEQ